VPLLQGGALVCAFGCALLFLPVLNFLGLPRFMLGLFALPLALIALGGQLAVTLYQAQNRFRFWAFLLVLGGIVRLVAATVFAGAEPWAESALAACACAGFVLLAPVLRPVKATFSWTRFRSALDGRGLHFAASFCAVLGIFLCTSVDRIVAQLWFGRATDNNLGLVRWDVFDGYQTAGLLARSLIWGLQPMLLILLARRAQVEQTGRGLRGLFWLYLGLLILGAILLPIFGEPLARLFGGGNEQFTVHFLPRFALAMVPLGFVQGLGFFALASRRYPECFTLGAGGIAYTIFLSLFGKPQLLLSYMFGGGMVVALLVLSVGVARWGRRQP
jgi:hypothetical protein